MLTWEILWHYFKTLVMNGRITKAIAWACFAFATELVCCDRLISIQFIFIWWLVTTIIGVVWWSLEEWFSFRKLILGLARYFVYMITLSLFMMADKAFDTSFIFKFWYAYIIIDMIKIFFRHSPYIGISINPWLISFVNKLENRVQEYFLKKIWLNEDLNSKPKI